VSKFRVSPIKVLRNIAIVLIVLYLGLFALTKVIRYPEPIAAIKLGLAPASKTPGLMPAHTFSASPATVKMIPTGTKENPQTVTWYDKKVSIQEFFDATKTNAFIIIRDGKITYEKYLNGKTESSQLPSYSVAKTMTSIMIGQLIDQGRLLESDKFVSILPEFKSGTDFDKINIRQLLDMQAGVGVSDNYPTGPAGWGVAIAQLYASTDINWFLEHNRKMATVPGKEAEYRSVETQMLGMVIKKITGERVADYFSREVWQKVGAEFDGTWNVDHINGTEKTFCCFNAAARDYAKVGLELLKPKSEVVSPHWLKRLSTPVVKLDRNWGYSAQIWHPTPDVMMFLGLHGQYIYVDPARQTVIVKSSDEPTDNGDNENWTAKVLREISLKQY
jgi:CubicO group peptidase (beta-lactamase class C family)